MALLRLLAGLVASWPQGATSRDVWTATPADGGASVGDTVWLERSVSLPAGWRLRAGRLEGSDEVEALSDPVVVRRGDTWIVRYPVAAWTPGSHRVVLPSMWRLG